MRNPLTVDRHSIKSIYLTPRFNEQELASATGFIVKRNNEYFLITNRHVVTGRHNITNKCLDEKHSGIPNNLMAWIPFNDGIMINWKAVSISLYDENENPIWMEHPIYKNKIDVVALKLSMNIDDIFCYNLMSDYVPIVTGSVFIIGYPYGFNVNPKIGKYAIWSNGTIASDPALNLNIDEEQLPAFLIDAKTRQGQSGSPVIYYNASGIDVNERGIGILGGPVKHEIGIYSGRIDSESDLGYVWKWSVINDILSNEKE